MFVHYHELQPCTSPAHAARGMSGSRVLGTAGVSTLWNWCKALASPIHSSLQKVTSDFVIAQILLAVLSYKAGKPRSTLSSLVNAVTIQLSLAVSATWKMWFSTPPHVHSPFEYLA